MCVRCGSKILEPYVRNNLRHRRRPQLNEESFGSFNLLPPRRRMSGFLL